VSTAESTSTQATYTYAVVTGSDQFRLDGDVLETRGPLTAGTHEVTVRSTDPSGAYADRTFTITVAAPTPPAPGTAGTGPSISAVATSRTGTNRAGWSRTPVTVAFACAPSPGATLTSTCPEKKIKDKQVRNRLVSRTVTDTTGRSATATVVVKIDRIDPTARPRGVRNGATYSSERTVRCRADDAFSGVRRCRVTTQRHHRADGTTRITYRLVAKDNAGNKTTRTGRYYVG
jgi:hypothetical protein